MIKNFFDYLVSTIVSRALGFLLIPYMISRMTASEYGQLGLIFITIYFIFDLIHHSSSGYYSLYFFKNKEESDSSLMWRIISEQLVFLLGLSCIFILIYFFFNESLWINGLIIMSAYLIVFSRSLNFLFLSYFKVKEMSRKYGIVELFEALSVAGITVFLFEFNDATIENRLLSTAIGTFLALMISILCFGKSIKSFRLNINLKKIKEVFIFGAKLYPHVFGSLILLASDRLFLSYYHTLTDVGIYTVAFQYASVLLILNTLSNRIFQPKAYDYFNSKNTSKANFNYLTPFWIRYILLILITTFFLAFSVVSFSKWLYPNEYFYGLFPTLILMAAFMFYWIATVPVPFFMNSNENRFLSYSTSLALALNLIGNQLLVPSFGTFGASFATLLAIFIAMIFSYYFAGRLYKKELIHHEQ